MEDLLTISEVAKIYNVPERNVRYAIKSGKIKASRIGWIWVIERKNLPKTWFGRERNVTNAKDA